VEELPEPKGEHPKEWIMSWLKDIPGLKRLV